MVDGCWLLVDGCLLSVIGETLSKFEIFDKVFLAKLNHLP